MRMSFNRVSVRGEISRPTTYYYSVSQCTANSFCHLLLPSEWYCRLGTASTCGLNCITSERVKLV